MSLIRIKLTISNECFYRGMKTCIWRWNVPTSHRSLNWLVEILVDGNECCVGAYDPTLNAHFQHLFLIVCWSICEAHVLGLDEGLGSKAMNGEAKRKRIPAT